MIGACGWIVFLWDIDRLFFSLERKIDTQTVSEAGADGSLLGRVRDMLSSKVQHLRAEAVRSIEKAYWEDINAGGVLAFPQPNIARAIEHIDEGRRDLLAPLTELVARTVPVGNSPAALVSRVLFRYLAPEVNGTKWRDIMSSKESCGGCPRVAVWSSPTVLIKGEVAGTAILDNARVIAEQAARVAAFR